MNFNQSLFDIYLDAFLGTLKIIFMFLGIGSAILLILLPFAIFGAIIGFLLKADKL